MHYADFYRIAEFVLGAAGIGFMVAVNVLAWKVLRPAKRLGFLWWHISTISVAYLCFLYVGFHYVFNRIASNEGIDAVGYIFGLGLLLFTAAQIIIFNVEAQRYAEKRAEGLPQPDRKE